MKVFKTQSFLPTVNKAWKSHLTKFSTVQATARSHSVLSSIAITTERAPGDKTSFSEIGSMQQLDLRLAERFRSASWCTAKQCNVNLGFNKTATVRVFHRPAGNVAWSLLQRTTKLWEFKNPPRSLGKFPQQSCAAHGMRYCEH
jgi:hypothetical protein